jgi:hypothetical protein
MSRWNIGLLTGALLVGRPAAIPAQADASLVVGVGTVRFPGGTTVGAFSVVPGVQISSPGRDISVGGTFASLPSGNGYVQGRFAAWMATAPLAGHWRLAGEAQLTGATRGAGLANGAGQLAVEGLFAARRWGVGAAAGPVSGWILGAAPVTAWRARLRSWWRDAPGHLEVVASIEPTRFLGAWFTDVGSGLVARSGRLEARLSASARVSRAYGSKGAALASAELRLSPRVSLEAVGGNVLPDPYQGLPPSGFVTAGVRVRLPLRTGSPDALVQSRSFRVSRRGDEIVIRLRRSGARDVAVAGDWNGWTAVPLVRIGRDQWELPTAIPRGSHHFVMIIDGAPWQIPDGVPSVADGMGGRVAVLTVF